MQYVAIVGKVDWQSMKGLAEAVCEAAGTPLSAVTTGFVNNLGGGLWEVCRVPLAHDDLRKVLIAGGTASFYICPAESRGDVLCPEDVATYNACSNPPRRRNANTIDSKPCDFCQTPSDNWHFMLGGSGCDACHTRFSPLHAAVVELVEATNDFATPGEEVTGDNVLQLIADFVKAAVDRSKRARR